MQLTIVTSDSMTPDIHCEEIPEVPGYTIIETLGHGGMAIVYLAVQHGFNRKVALKVMSRRLSLDKQLCRRFKREAEIVAKFNSPYIISVYEVGEHDGLQYFSMEYLPCGTLSMRILRGIDPKSALDITKQVASALEVAHKYDRGFIHRDVKPDNILFRDDDTVVLADFGIARSDHLSDSDTTLTQYGQVIGSARYMSLEQVKGEELNLQTDLYSLGIVLFQMLTKKLPYTGPDFSVIAIKKINDPIPKLPRHISYLQPIIDKALAKDRSERFKSATEFIDAISAIQSNHHKNNIFKTSLVRFNWLTMSVFIGVLSSLLIYGVFDYMKSPVAINSIGEHELNLKIEPHDAKIYLLKQSRFINAHETFEKGAYDLCIWAPQYLIKDIKYTHPSNSDKIITLQKIKNPSASVYYKFSEAIDSKIAAISEHFIQKNPQHPLSELLKIAVLKDYSMLDMIKQHAHIGDEQSLLILSELYYNGWGVKQDKAKALELAERASHYGYSLAQVQYATLILGHNPSTEQIKKATVLYDKAAENGFFLGLNRRAKLYINGKAGEKNIDQGLALLTQAASLGDRDALFWLGKIYEYGQGSVAQNKIKAKHYFERAAKLGHQRAINHLPARH
jgi:serine/threonine protein kinase